MSPKRATPITSDNPAVAGPRAYADRLYRAACECVRQRQRYGALVEAGMREEEQVAALKVAKICDEVLNDAISAFEGNPPNGPTKDEEWYRKGVMLWQASREYERKHGATDLKMRRLAGQSADQLRELAMEYDLEASAMLALQHALTAYRKSVPEAHLEALASRIA